MAYKVLIADTAKSSLDRALHYISDVLSSPAAASKLLVSYLSFLDKVADMPFSYPKCRDHDLSKRGIRKALLDGYVALYAIEEKAVMVIGFFHQKQDYARLV